MSIIPAGRNRLRVCGGAGWAMGGVDRVTIVASDVRDIPAGDLTAEQVDLLVGKLTALHAELSEVIVMMGRYAAAGRASRVNTEANCPVNPVR